MRVPKSESKLLKASTSFLRHNTNTMAYAEAIVLVIKKISPVGS